MTEGSAGKGLILSESRRLRLFSFFLFYVCQGLPYGLTTIALPVWVAANGGTSAQVASVLAMAYLPWSWKFIIAALVDRYTWLPMGRRRVWLILAQVLMSAGFAGAAVLGPGPTEVDVLLVVTFLVMGGGAMQDVVVDALAVDVLPEEEQGTASAFMFGGQAVGGALAGAGAAAGLQYLGSATTFLLFIPFLLIPTIYSAFILERPGEKRFPWSAGETAPQNRELAVADWLAIFRFTLKSLVKGPSLVFLVAQTLIRTGGGVILPMWPLLATTYVGMDETAFGAVSSTAGLVMAVVAIGLGSLVSATLGPKRGAALVAIGFGAVSLFVMFGKPFWVIYAIFVSAFAWNSLMVVLSGVFSNPLRMQLCDRRVSATQFTIYNSLANLPVSLGSLLFATLGGIEQLTRTMLCAAALFGAAAVAFALLKMPRSGEPEEGLAPVFD